MICFNIIFFLAAIVPVIWSAGMCNNQMMKNNEICCNNEKRRKDSHTVCCRGRNPNDDRFYNSSTSICCNGIVNNRYVTSAASKSRREMFCCGDFLFDKALHLCCDDSLHKLSEMYNPKCCGGEVFDISGDLQCCDDRIIDINTHKCAFDQGIPTVIYRQQNVCGGTKIELYEKTCCFGAVSDIPYLNPTNPQEMNPHSQCCGQTGYNSQTHKCCEPNGLTKGVVVPKHGHLQCCGSEPMDPLTQVCCNGKVVDKNGHADTCCGRSLINTSTQGCCDGKPFYSKTHYCCEGRPSQPLKIGLNCCGGKKMEDNQLCCDDQQPISKTSEMDDKCCLLQNIDNYSYAPYNSKEKDCTDMTVVTRLGPNDRVCFGSRFLPSEAVCCGYQVHEFPPGQNLGCCTDYDYNQNIYNKDTQMCCRGTIHNHSSSEYECCGNMSFKKYAPGNPCRQCDPTKMTDPHMICCVEQQYVKSIYGDSCCHMTPYLKHISTCCNGKLYDTPGVKCCGTQAYSSQRSTCCDGKIVQKPYDLCIASSSGSRLKLRTISVAIAAVFSLAVS